MGRNTDLLQSDLGKITPRLFEEAAFLAFYNGIEHRAPLGFRGPDIQLFGESRRSEVSVCNYSNKVSMLITDTEGSFLFYGYLNAGLPLETIGLQLHAIFQTVRPFIEAKAPNVGILINHLATR